MMELDDVSADSLTPAFSAMELDDATADSLMQAFRTVLDPLATKVERCTAENFVADFKRNSADCSAVGFTLARNLDPVIRSFGLRLIKYVIQFRWCTITIHEKRFIKESVMGLVNVPQTLLSEAVLKEGIASLVVEIAKQEWPRNWPLFLEDISVDCPQNGWKSELSSIVLLRLSEDIGILENVENDTSRRNLKQLFKQNLGRILECLDSILTHHFYLLSGEGATGADMLSETKIIQGTLKAISSIYQWCSVAVIGEDHRGTFGKLLQLMRDPRFRINAAECLIAIFSRRDPHSKVLMKFFEGSFFDSITSSVDSDDYEFKKKIVEVFVSLGGLFVYVGGRDPNFTIPQCTDAYFKNLVNLVDANRLDIREVALVQVNSLLRAAGSGLRPIVDFVLPLLVPVLIKRLQKVTGSSDVNDVNTFDRFLCLAIESLEIATALEPGLCVTNALTNYRAAISESDATRIHAACLAVDCILKTNKRRGNQNYLTDCREDLEHVLKLRPNTLTIDCLSSLIHCCQSTVEAKRVFRYCCEVFESPDFVTLRQDCGNLLLKMAKTLRGLMLPLLTDIIQLARRLLVRDSVSSADLGTVQCCALVLVNDLPNHGHKTRYLSEVAEPLQRQCSEVPVGHVEFLQFHGLLPPLMDNRTFSERRLELLKFLTMIYNMLKIVRPYEGRNLAFSIIAEALPKFFVIAKALSQIYSWSKSAPVEVAQGLGLTKGEKVHFRVSEGNPHSPLAKEILKTIPVAYKHVCNVVEQIGPALGEQLYTLPIVNESILHVVSDIGNMPATRQKMMLQGIQGLVASCPLSLHEQFCVPLGEEVRRQVRDEDVLRKFGFWLPN